jgi:transposase
MYIEELIPPDSPVRLVNKIVDGSDIKKIMGTYKGGGTSGYHPRMMLKIILFAYLNNIYSRCKIEEANRYNILYMWLSAGQTPDHNTINTFGSQRFKDTIHDIFTQVVLKLVEPGHLSLDVVYVDGTKVESRAGRYTFVWKKTVEKNREKSESKIRKVSEQVEEDIAQDGLPEDPSTPILSAELKRRIDKMNTENGSEKSKNESDTPNTLTFPDFMKGFKKRYAKMPEKSVADAGYGSEENYDFTGANNIEPFIKYNIFEEEQKDDFKNNLRIAQNLYYNEASDCFVCPMGRHMENTGSGTRRSESGFVSPSLT